MLASLSHKISGQLASHVRNALARLGGSGCAIRNASICATSADSGTACRAAARSSARQNNGSRLIDVEWPAIVTERLTGPANPPGGAGIVRGPSAADTAAGHSASNSAASCSMIVPPSCSASMIVTARL